MLNHANLVLLVQLHGWFPSMHTHHAWVLLEEFLSLDFWVIGKPGLLQEAAVSSNLCYYYSFWFSFFLFEVTVV